MKAEDQFCRPSGKKYLSKINLTKGYWQIEVAPEDVYIAVFVTPDGQYKFLRMPFGGLKKIVRDCQELTTKKQVRSFLGLVGYYREHIPAFAEASAPLSDLLKKGKSEQVQWNEALEHAYSLLKEYLLQELVLKLPTC